MNLRICSRIFVSDATNCDYSFWECSGTSRWLFSPSSPPSSPPSEPSLLPAAMRGSSRSPHAATAPFGRSAGTSSLPRTTRSYFLGARISIRSAPNHQAIFDRDSRTSSVAYLPSRLTVTFSCVPRGRPPCRRARPRGRDKPLVESQSVSEKRGGHLGRGGLFYWSTWYVFRSG